MFPNIKSKSQKILQLKSVLQKSKNKEWNDRFVLQSMPQYSPLKDPHIKKYRKQASIIHKNPQLQNDKSVNPLHKSLVQRKLSGKLNIDQQQFQNIMLKIQSPKVQKQPQIIKQLDYKHKIQQLMDKLQLANPQYSQDVTQFYKVICSHAMPEFYIYFYFKGMYKKLKLQSLIKRAENDKIQTIDIKSQFQKQIKQIKCKQNYFYKISGCWRSRQKFIQVFSKFISQKIQNQQQVYVHKDKIKQHITNLRLLTSNLIQNIIKWRSFTNIQNFNYFKQLYQAENNTEQFWMINEERPIFYVQNSKSRRRQNLLVKILNDNKFILESKISSCVNMGTKNDPFMLSPILKSQGKQKSQYLQMFQLTMQAKAKYHKIMQYLANQKAYDLKLKQRRPLKRSLSQVQKVYKNKNRPINKHQLGYSENEVQNQEDIHQYLKRSRLQRIKKNQNRIDMIKAAYDKNSAQNVKKLDQQEDMLQLLVKKKQSKQPVDRTQFDQQFDELVQQKYKLLNLQFKQSQKIRKHTVVVNNSQSKQPPKKIQTHQQKMISKVKSLNDQLRQKLKQLNKDTDEKNLNSDKSQSPSRFIGKTNKQIVQQLKKEIVSKIQNQEQERAQIKKRKKQEQQKIFEQLRLKIKSQMEEKLAKKKQEKLQEKQQLQKQLVKEQSRINQQKQLQIAMLVKLNKQRQLRMVQKLKRQSIQKQNILKQQLLKQQMLRKQKQQQIQKQRLQKDKILKQLELKELRVVLEKQIRSHYQGQNKKQIDIQIQKNNQSIQKLTKSLVAQQKKTEIIETSKDLNKEQVSKPSVQKDKQRMSMQQLKLLKQMQLKKQMTLLKDKQERQINLIQKQNQIRQRMLKYKKNQQQEVGKDIDDLMRKKIMLQKQKFASIKISQNNNNLNEQQLKKIEVLNKIQKQEQQQRARQAQFAKIRKQRQVEQQMLRQKIRQRIQKQLRQQAIKKTKKQIDDREQKQFLRKKQQGEYRTRIFNQNPINKDNIIQQQRSRIIATQFLSKQVNQQNAKSSLRSIFQKQLFASSLPPKFYDEKQFIKVKNTGQYLKDEYIYQKMQNNKQDIQKINQIQHSPLKKSLVRQHIFELTDEQLYVYKKQKSKNMENIPVQEKVNKSKYQLQKKQNRQEYQLMDIKDQSSDNQKKFSVKVFKNRNNKVERKLKNEPEDSEEQAANKISKNKQTKNVQKKQNIELKKKNRNQLRKEQSHQEQKRSKNKKKALAITPRESTETKSERQLKMDPILKVLSKKAVKPLQKPQRDQDISDSQYQQKVKKQRLQKKNKDKRNAEKNKKVQSQQELKQINKNQKSPNLQSVNKISRKKITNIPKQQSYRFNLQFDAIPQGQLDHQLQNHFNRIPIQQTNILTMNRFQLFKKLSNQLTFSLINGMFQNKMIGVAYVYHDRYSASSVDTRRFIITHVATYSNKDLMQFILAICNFMLLKDPCDQVQFIYHFNQNQEQQSSMSNEIIKWFNQLGSIYQKKLDENIFQRKFVLKRQFYHKCEININGINKNVFKNIVSINVGMLISASPVIKNKQYFMADRELDYQQQVLRKPQNKLIYMLLLCEMFRQYMSPQEAEVVKQKLKSSQKSKQLLANIVTLQKKKLKIQQYRLSQYKNIIELNMKLMSHGKQTIKYVQDVTGSVNNQIFYGEMNYKGAIMFNFQIASLPIVEKQNQVDYRGRSLEKLKHVSYFRLNPMAAYKLNTVKSSLYNSQMYMFATDNSKLKVFIISAQQYLQIKWKQKQQSDSSIMQLNLSTYIQLFSKNISKYSQDTQYKNIWIPEILPEKSVSEIKNYKQFYSRQVYLQESLSMSYKQFIPSGIIIQPQHRDLVISAPFVIGVMSMSVEQILQGSPLYARLVTDNDVRTMEVDQTH